MRRIIACVMLAACGEVDGDAAAGTSSTSSSTTSTSTSTSSSTSSSSTTTTIGDTSGSSSTVGDGSSDDDGSTGFVEPGPDLRELGPHATGTTDDSFSTGGCMMGYTITSPTDVDAAPTVILAHGFQGNRASMANWAAHYASWGLVVVTPDLCHATIVDADHAQNGVDLVALADHLALATPIYAGYSAGGLAAVLAAAQDPDALALVGLDMVDSGGLGAGVAASIAIPANDVTAEPAMCNSTANGVPVFAAIPDAQTLRIVEADHCDFQSPPDGFCSLCSGPNPGHSDEDIAAAIRGLTTAALVWRSGLDDSGAQWWTPGNMWFDMLVESGAMNEL